MSVMKSSLLLLFLSPLFHANSNSEPFDLQAALQDIASAKSKEYNCSIAFAIKSADVSLAAVGGDTAGRPSQLSDRFVWGSVTKSMTGASIIRLTESGAFGLDDPIPPLVDPIIAKMAANSSEKFASSLRELFGEGVEQVTVRNLLAMQSGIPDFDTATPRGKHPTDSFRAEVYADPSHMFGPMELLNLPWVKTGSLLFPPGSRTRYSSCNFILLGLILANHHKVDAWQQFNQAKALPNKLRAELSDIRFGTQLAPSAFTEVHGYDTTNYNNQTEVHDVWGVKGVFSGWTASDLVATVTDVAKYAYALFGPDYEFLSPAGVDLMIPTGGFYGLATFNLTGRTGERPNVDTAYGHLGATYGYDSIMTFHPYINVSIAVATSIERLYQEQPADTLCFVYNTVLNHVQGLPQPHCKYDQSSYYSAGCNCTTPSSSP